MTNSLYHQSKLASYCQIRSASHGAGVSLLDQGGEYVATFDCAMHIASVIGTRTYSDVDNVPRIAIPTAEMQSTLAKIAARFSVALVDLVADENGLSFVCVWRIECAGVAEEPELAAVGDDLSGY